MFQRTPDGTYVYVVAEPTTVHKTFEVAAWWERLVLHPGTYPVKLTDSAYRPIHEGETPYWAIVHVPATIIARYTPSLYGGVRTGGNAEVQHVNDPATHHIQIYGYQLPA